MKNFLQKRDCVGWILQFTVIFAYFGSSDTDTDVLHPLGVNVNFPPGSSGASSSTPNNGKRSMNDVDTSGYKLRTKRASEDTPHDTNEMKLWDQIFANALATSNTSQWVHLREIFDRVEEELHKTKSTGNTSLNQLNKIHNSFLVPHPPHQATFVGPLPKTLGRSKHPKFIYHRVSGPLRGRGRPFAAVSLATADSEDHTRENKATENTLNADHTSWESKNDHFFRDADYPHDQHGRESAEEHETLLNDDFSHFKNFDHSEPTSHLSNKFKSFQNFDGPSSSRSSKNAQFEVTGHNHLKNGKEDRVLVLEDRSHSHVPASERRDHYDVNKGRHHHHHHKDKAGHFHLRTWESQDDMRPKDCHHHHQTRRQRKKHYHKAHLLDQEYLGGD
ncbi:uncharacterized protein LOC118434602 [Folsomia candida]|uniref:uncharacterized protein LOC118434602 n=1 Tax=Folsomia candida TaxID=158441 RepID=UPI001604F48B|nr:uncharacterized protein LOC118434602 [Folsomia candida]